MGKVWIRTWVEDELDQIKNHILIAGELSSDCGKCKEIGLDIKTTKTCPNCGTTYKYITTRLASGNAGERFTVIKRIRAKCPDLIFVDYDDFKKLTSRSIAEDFLRGN
jgi:hypothetical protein